ncbi:MAG: AAA family ATPase [Aquificaceae bacterium]|nr:AAA family ATPase [Aquificaceae bacterium]MCX7990117.1 AAA family ATPase [Aquificaceae bacterium]MDW8097295.1 AAA family ATPase [Aquificaceae bacterium]
MIVVLMGLSGSGKSFLSRILHEDLGFEWLRSDQIRKELAGIDPNTKASADYRQGIYSQEWTKRVYQELMRRAQQIAEQGKDVVLDATFLESWQRNLVRDSFPQALFLLAQAEEKEILKRLRDRKDISDAGVEVYLKQKESFTPPSYAIPVNTQRSREELKVALQEILLQNGWRGTLERPE